MAIEVSFCKNGVATSYNMTHIWRTTSGGTVFSSNLINTGFAFFTLTSVVNDAIYFGYDSSAYYAGRQFACLRLNIDTAFAGTGITGEWEYEKSAGVWLPIDETCTMTDNTNGLTTTGTNEVRFGCLPFLTTLSTTINSQRLGFVIRYRLTAVTTITNAGANHATTMPLTYDGLIRVTGATQAVPSTPEIWRTQLNANYPEVNFIRLGDTTVEAVGGTYLMTAMPNLNHSEAWFHTENNHLLIGNGSQWYSGTIGGYWTDGVRLGNTGFYGSKITICFSKGGGWAGGTDGITVFAGSQFNRGVYSRTIAGTFYTGAVGGGYLNMGTGSWVSINCSNLGQGYWTGGGEIRNVSVVTGFVVHFPVASTMTIDGIFVSNSTLNSTGLFGLYSNVFGAVAGSVKGLNWYLNPAGVSYLFYPQSIADANQHYYRFTNPSPAFPTDNSDANIKLINLSGTYYTLGWNIQEYYTVDLKVVDKDGVAISGATVTALDKDGTQSFSVTTDANGEIAQQTILRMHAYYSGGLVSNVRNPYTINVTASGYDDVSFKMTIEEAVDSVILMKANPQPYTQGILIDKITDNVYVQVA